MADYSNLKPQLPTISLGSEVSEKYEKSLKQSKAEVTKKPPKRVFHAIRGSEGDYQCDICFMKFSQSAKYKKLNQGFTCLLLCCEVPTRFAFAVAMKDKTPQQVIPAFKKVYNSVIEDGKIFQNLTTDAGSEFNNAEWDQMLDDLKITQYVKEPSDRYSLGIIDRMTRSIKEWVTDWQTENEDLSWYTALPIIIDKYNEHQISTLKASPEELREYGDKYRTAQAKTEERGKPGIAKFKQFAIGDHVRVRLRPEDQPGELGKRGAKTTKGVERWSNKTYRIKSIDNLSFALEDMLGNAAARTYRQHELMKIPDTSTDVPQIFKEVAIQARASRRTKREKL
jgi:hypothetical protein